MIFSLRMAVAVGLLIGMGLLFLLTKTVEFNVELWAGFQLMPVWLVMTSCLVFLPRLSMFGPTESFAALIFAVLVCAYVALHEVNRGELSVVFRHQTEMEELAEIDLATTGYRIEGSSGIRPHGFGLALAVSLQQFAWVIAATATHRQLTPLTGALVSIGAYCIAVIVWTVFIIQRRCSPAGWAKMLNTRSQVLGQEYSGQQLLSVLAAIQRKLIRREALAQIVLIAAACALLYRFRIPGTQLPLALPLIFWLSCLCGAGPPGGIAALFLPFPACPGSGRRHRLAAGGGRRSSHPEQSDSHDIATQAHAYIRCRDRVYHFLLGSGGHDECLEGCRRMDNPPFRSLTCRRDSGLLLL